MAFQYTQGGCKKEGNRVFIRACSDKTKANRFKLKEERLRLNIRKKLFTIRLMRHWTSLHRDVVDPLSQRHSTSG